MSKLFRLKQWLTIDETVLHLSTVLGEPIQAKDVFRLVLDGHLQLSVDFVNQATVNKGRFIREDEVEFREMSNILNLPRSGIIPDTITYTSDLMFDGDRFVRLEEEVVSIDGVWDLPMIGGECLDIEHRYQFLTGGPEITLSHMEGPFVENDGVVCRIVERFEDYDFEKSMVCKEKGIEGRIVREELSGEPAEELRQKFKDEYEIERFKLYKKDAFYPADTLPDDSVFVVRSSAILNLLNSLDDPFMLTAMSGAESGRDSLTNVSSEETLLFGSVYWKKLNSLACLAISSYPAWMATQSKIQKTGNLQDWLVSVIKADNREAEFIKKVLIDTFKELR